MGDSTGKPRTDLFALHAAVATGQLAEVKRLLVEGADPQLKGPDGRRPIHLAVATGSGPITEALLEAGAKSVDRDSSGWTAMNYALVTENLKLLQALLAATKGPWLSKGQSWSLLHVAAERGDARAMQLLLDAGGRKRIDIKDLRGRTPLHVAAGKDAGPVAALLLEHGASPKAVTDDGHSVWDLVHERQAAAVARVLQRHLPEAKAKARKLKPKSKPKKPERKKRRR